VAEVNAPPVTAISEARSRGFPRGRDAHEGQHCGLFQHFGNHWQFVLPGQRRREASRAWV